MAGVVVVVVVVVFVVVVCCCYYCRLLIRSSFLPSFISTPGVHPDSSS